MPNLIKNIPNQKKKNKLKTGIFFGLSAYWGIIIVGTFTSFWLALTKYFYINLFIDNNNFEE